MKNGSIKNKISGADKGRIDNKICYLKGVGPKKAELFLKLGVRTIGDVVGLFPRDYQDWTKPLLIGEAPFNEKCCIRATICSCMGIRKTFTGSTAYTIFAEDDFGGSMRIVIFNNRYVAEQLEMGKEFLFFGKVEGNSDDRQMNSPLFEEVCCDTGLHPVYPATAGLDSRKISSVIKTALQTVKDELPDPLPTAVREYYKLCDIGYAYENIHFPTDYDALATARRRLVFDELLTLRIGMLQLKGRKQAQTKIILNNDFSGEFFDRLPFEPTGAQRRAAADIAGNMSSGRAMNRLLQGDVGSGKTAVAAAAVYSAVKNGYQCAFMAPTSILAEQHYNTLKKMLTDTGITVELLTGSLSPKEKKQVYGRLESGETSVVTGTHALIQEKVTFDNLGLVITDEQHRFGVNQRARLAEKGENPHTLVMSATPIPRSLALIIYGDLDLSVLDEMPPGRMPVATYAVSGALRNRAYDYVKKHLDAGYQGYVVCPLVEQSENVPKLVSVNNRAEILAKRIFKEYPVGIIHGKMKNAEKEAVMRDFCDNKIKLLVATTVIEVGIDVPNAVIMVIENAERFGLSQLHQLRGRVGRGKARSTCILISDTQSEDSLRRLGVMRSTNDGFKIADEDLKMRGPGDFFGSRQHGLPQLKIADMMNDTELIALTSQTAERIYSRDNKLEKPENEGLRQNVQKLFGAVSENGFN